MGESTYFDRNEKSHVNVVILILACMGSPKKDVYSLALVDTSGQENYPQLRRLAYPQTDVFIVLYALHDPNSFENATKTWIPEIVSYSPGTPYTLVAVDRWKKRDSFDESEYSLFLEKGKEFAKQNGVPFALCYPKAVDGKDKLKDVFDMVRTEDYICGVYLLMSMAGHHGRLGFVRV